MQYNYWTCESSTIKFNIIFQYNLPCIGEPSLIGHRKRSQSRHTNQLNLLTLRSSSYFNTRKVGKQESEKKKNSKFKKYQKYLPLSNLRAQFCSVIQSSIGKKHFSIYNYLMKLDKQYQTPLCHGKPYPQPLFR